MNNKLKLPLIKSEFALLDVERGRRALFEALGNAGNTTAAPIPVVITGEIVGAWGDDDGTSRGFEVRVTKVDLP